jgi:hypothetical protein
MDDHKFNLLFEMEQTRDDALKAERAELREFRRAMLHWQEMMFSLAAIQCLALLGLLVAYIVKG